MPRTPCFNIIKRVDWNVNFTLLLLEWLENLGTRRSFILNEARSFLCSTETYDAFIGFI